MGGGLELRAVDKAETPPRSADQWNEWAINTDQWAARIASLKSRGSAEQPLFACAAPRAVEGPSASLHARLLGEWARGPGTAALSAEAGALRTEVAWEPLHHVLWARRGPLPGAGARAGSGSRAVRTPTARGGPH